MRPSDYTNFKITEPTQATIIFTNRDDRYHDAIQQIAYKYIFEHFKQPGIPGYLVNAQHTTLPTNVLII